MGPRSESHSSGRAAKKRRGSFIRVSDAFFSQTGPRSYAPTEHVVGPWNPAHMHGGPPSALIAHAMIDQIGAETAPVPGFICRFTAEILRPVPVEELVIDVRLARAGRRIALAEASMTAAGAPVMLARAWFIRTTTVSVPETRRIPPPPTGAAPDRVPPDWGRGYLQAIEWSQVDGSFGEPGPATAWTRSRYPLVAGQPLSGIERVLLVADSGNGLSAVANPAELIFVNPELSVHLTRPPDGERIWMRSETFLEPDGVGLASTVLGDAGGQIGVGQQSLFVAPVEMRRTGRNS